MGSACSRAIVDAKNNERIGPNPTLMQLQDLIEEQARGRGARITSPRKVRAQRRMRALAEETRIRPKRTMPENRWDGIYDPLPSRTIRPIAVPSEHEIVAAKARLLYQERSVHIAITGAAGSHKYSLLKAFLGRKDTDSLGAATAGVQASQTAFPSYPHPAPGVPVVWYVVPSSETLPVPGWKYFNDGGLFLFDAILVVLDQDGCFAKSDLAILRGCAHFDIPVYTVCAGAHTDRVCAIMWPSKPDGPDDARAKAEQAFSPDQEAALWHTARTSYMRTTEAAVDRALKDAELPAQSVYFIEESTLLAVMKGKAQLPAEFSPFEARKSRSVNRQSMYRRLLGMLWNGSGGGVSTRFDEWELLGDICQAVRRRRVLESDYSRVDDGLIRLVALR